METIPFRVERRRPAELNSPRSYWEIDGFPLFDHESRSGKFSVADAKHLELGSKARGNYLKFRPSASEPKIQRPLARVNSLDPYDLEPKNSFGKQPSRAPAFRREPMAARHGRFSHPKLFGKDYSISGWQSNWINGGSQQRPQAAGGGSSRRPASAPEPSPRQGEEAPERPRSSGSAPGSAPTRSAPASSTHSKETISRAHSMPTAARPEAISRCHSYGATSSGDALPSMPSEALSSIIPNRRRSLRQLTAVTACTEPADMYQSRRSSTRSGDARCPRRSSDISCEQHRNRTAVGRRLSIFEAEVQDGRSAIVYDGRQFERRCAVAALHLHRDDRRILALLASRSPGHSSVGCKLPARKQKRGESASGALGRLLKEELAPFAASIELDDHTETEEIVRNSVAFGVQTNYTRTVMYGKLVGTCAAKAINAWDEVPAKNYAPDGLNHVFVLQNQDTFFLCAWLSPEEYGSLKDPKGQAALAKWMSNIPDWHKPNSEGEDAIEDEPMMMGSLFEQLHES